MNKIKNKLWLLKRWMKFKIHQLIYGFDPRDCWSLDYSLAKWLLPRLKYFRNNKCSYPSSLESLEEWKSILDKMIYSFQFIIDDRLWEITTDEENRKLEEGLDLFRIYYFNLWD